MPRRLQRLPDALQEDALLGVGDFRLARGEVDADHDPRLAPRTRRGGNRQIRGARAHVEHAFLSRQSERTNRAGVETLLQSLKDEQSGVQQAIIVEIPRQRSFMHLDTIFTFISRNECLIYPPVILPSGWRLVDIA